MDGEGESPVTDEPVHAVPTAEAVPGAAEDFAALYREQRAALVWHVRSHGATESEACDAVQEAFAAALRAAGRIRDRRAWPAWLRTVAVRCYLRSRSGRGRPGAGGRAGIEVVQVAEVPERPGAAGAVGDIAEAHRQQEFVLSMLAALPDRQRRVFTLHYEGWSTAEIAGRLGMEAAAVRQNLARARRTLRLLLTQRGSG